MGLTSNVGPFPGPGPKTSQILQSFHKTEYLTCFAGSSTNYSITFAHRYYLIDNAYILE